MRVALRGVLIGLVAGVLNLCGWMLYVRVASPLEDEMPILRSAPPPPATTGLALDLNACADCPRFELAGRGLLTPWAGLTIKLWWWTNYPALAVSAEPPGRLGIRHVRELLFYVLSVFQWLAAGWVFGDLLPRMLEAIRRYRADAVGIPLT